MHDIFFFTDIHGMYDLYRAIMNYCNEQDPEATIIFGGDACDRGRHGYKIMKELLDNPYVVYLKGNHEDMFVDAAREIKSHFDFSGKNCEEIKSTLEKTRMFRDRYIHIQDSLYNGGIDTLTDWVMDGMNMEFVDRIDKLPLTFSTDTCDFCHAAGVYQTFLTVAHDEYYEKPVKEELKNIILWTRSAFNIGWAPGRTAIFGHTPVPCLDEFMEMAWEDDIDIQPYKWVGKFDPEMTGAKIDMDTGAAFAGTAYVLNVRTMKAQGFEDLDVTAKMKELHDVKKIDCVQM